MIHWLSRFKLVLRYRNGSRFADQSRPHRSIWPIASTRFVHCHSGSLESTMFLSFQDLLRKSLKLCCSTLGRFAFAAYMTASSIGFDKPHAHMTSFSQSVFGVVPGVFRTIPCRALSPQSLMCDIFSNISASASNVRCIAWVQSCVDALHPFFRDPRGCELSIEHNDPSSIPDRPAVWACSSIIL